MWATRVTRSAQRDMNPTQAEVSNAINSVTNNEAKVIANAVRAALPDSQRRRLKAIHLQTRLHDAMITIRVFMYNVTAPDPEAYVFGVDELEPDEDDTDTVLRERGI